VSEILGLGTDLVEIDRLRLALHRTPGFAARVFSDRERAYAERSKDPAPSLAARFATKEAVMKALGVGLWKFALRDVEVAKARSGQPSVVLHARAAELAAERGVESWLLTLSHSKTTAIAVALAMG
jgi:holo-[acyl-carrier protein] synthase